MQDKLHSERKISNFGGNNALGKIQSAETVIINNAILLHSKSAVTCEWTFTDDKGKTWMLYHSTPEKWSPCLPRKLGCLLKYSVGVRMASGNPKIAKTKMYKNSPKRATIGFLLSGKKVSHWQGKEKLTQKSTHGLQFFSILLCGSLSILTDWYFFPRQKRVLCCSFSIKWWADIAPRLRKEKVKTTIVAFTHQTKKRKSIFKTWSELRISKVKALVDSDSQKKDSIFILEVPEVPGNNRNSVWLYTVLQKYLRFP